MKSRRKILVVLGHPSKKSLSGGLADAYFKGAKSSGFDVQKLYLPELKFDPILHEGYNKIQKLEPDLVESQKLIKWAEHIVFVYPIWWGNLPALFKGFIDRVFLPGFAFRYDKQGKPHKLLKGRTASLIMTTGGSGFFYSIIGRFMSLSMTMFVLRFVGIKTKNQIFFGGIRDPTKKQIKEALGRARILGEKGV